MYDYAFRFKTMEQRNNFVDYVEEQELWIGQSDDPLKVVVVSIFESTAKELYDFAQTL